MMGRLGKQRGRARFCVLRKLPAQMSFYTYLTYPRIMERPGDNDPITFYGMDGTERERTVVVA